MRDANVSYEVVSENSWIVIVLTASVKGDEREGQGHTSASLLHKSATWHCTVNIHCYYMSALLTKHFFLFVIDPKIEQNVCIKSCMQLGKSTTEILEMLYGTFGEHSFKPNRSF
jgi:hypothetical protein